MNTPPAFPRYR